MSKSNFTPEYNFTYLEHHFRGLNSVDVHNINLAEPVLIYCLRNGLEQEPENFNRVFAAYQSFLQRHFPNEPEEDILDIAICDWADFCWKTDHDRSVRLAAELANLTIFHYYELPQLYGSSMEFFADYLGLKPGNDLVELLSKLSAGGQ